MLGSISLLILNGCQYTATPADLLLNPRSTPDNAKLASAVRDALPPRAKLSLPDQGASDAAVNKADIDGDGRPEAIVTFVNDNDTQQVMVLKQTSGGGWKPWFTFAESSTYGIDLVRTIDLDHDGQPEVLIGWDQYGEPQHTLNIYHIEKGYNGVKPPVAIAEISYDTIGIGDADGDGKSELAVINLNRDQMKASIQVKRIAGNTVSEAASAPLNGAVNGYYNLVAGRIAPQRYGIIADAGVGAHSSYTVMLAWAGGKLIKIYPLPAASGEVTENNSRQTFGGDGNGDGILDINVTREAPGQKEGLPYSDLLWIEQYKQWDGAGRFKVVSERYVDSADGYELRFPIEWRGRYTIREISDDGDNEIAVDYYHRLSGRRAELFAVLPTPIADWSGKEKQLQGESRHYVILSKAEGFVYAAVWAAAPSGWPEREVQEYRLMLPDESKLRKIFKLLP
jgi:hypothetical protein